MNDEHKKKIQDFFKSAFGEKKTFLLGFYQEKVSMASTPEYKKKFEEMVQQLEAIGEDDEYKLLYLYIKLVEAEDALYQKSFKKISDEQVAQLASIL